MQNLQLVQEAAQELYKNKAGQIVALDVQGMTVICDYMLIAAGRTVNQVKALADDVDERMGSWACRFAAARGRTKADGLSSTTASCSCTSSTPRSTSITTSNACGRMAATALCCRLTRRICNRIQRHRAVRMVRSLPDVFVYG